MNPASLLKFFGKIGTIGGAMAGAGMAVEGVKKALPYVPEKFGGRKVEAVVAGPLDVLGTILDPLDLFGARKKKQDQDAAQLAAEQQRASDAGQARRAAEAAAKKAEKKADKAMAQAAALEKKLASEKNQLKRQKTATEAEKRRRYATLAKKTALAARYHQDPNQGNAMALAALEIAKQAMNPPATAASVLTSDMSSAAKSLVTDIVDTLNRFTAEPNYDKLVNRMAQGDQDAYEEFGAMVDDYGGGYGVELGELDGPDRKAKIRSQSRQAIADEVAGPCCSGCAYGVTCSGKGSGVIPDSMVSGDFDEDDDDEVMGPGAYYEEDETDGPDDDDDILISGPDIGLASTREAEDFYVDHGLYDPSGTRAMVFNYFGKD